MADEAEEGLGVGLSAVTVSVVVGAGRGAVPGSERGQEHRAFKLPVSASGRVFAVD